MRALSSTLTKAQQAASRDPPRVKITLTYGATTHVFEEDRIKEIKNPEDPYSQKAEVLLDDSDVFLDTLNLKGFKAVIANGLVTSAGAEYSDNAPLWVITQQFTSGPGLLLCTLNLEGILDLMARDEASESYSPEETDTKTVKTLLTQIITATLAAFNHCSAYQVVFDSLDSLIDTYKPKDTFRIREGDTRLSKIKWLLDKTGCVARPQKDGKIHIFKPTTTGTSYNYEHSLEEGHTFFAKAYKERLIIPNYVVVKSQPGDDPQYSGFAKDNESYARLPKRKTFRLRLESNDQAKDIAQAYIDKYRLGSDMGSVSVPMNVGAEIFDYDKVTDARQGDSRVGNIGYIYRHYKAGDNPNSDIFDMTFSFGNWFSVIRAQAALNQIMGLTDIGADFNRLWVKDLYAEHIWVDNVDFIWVDPEGNIDLSKIGDNLDNLSDGELFARVKSLHLEAGQIKMDEHIYYKAGYDPSTKMPGDADLDDIGDGVVYQRVKETDIQAGHIKVSSVTLFDGIWYNESGVTIDALEGVTIKGGKLILQDSGGGHSALLYIDASGYLRIDGWVRVITDSMYPVEDGMRNIGAADLRYLLMATYDINIDRYLIMESGARVIGDLIPYSDGGSDFGMDTRRVGSIYAHYLNIHGHLDMTGDVACDDVHVADKVDCERVVCHLIDGPDIYCRDVIPTEHETWLSGGANRAWYKSYAYGVYSSDGQIHSYQRQDDIALLKAIKSRKEKGRDVIDARSLPVDLVEENEAGECFVNVAGLAGLNIGIENSLLAKIEALESKVKKLEGKKNE